MLKPYVNFMIRRDIFQYSRHYILRKIQINVDVLVTKQQVNSKVVPNTTRQVNTKLILVYCRESNVRIHNKCGIERNYLKYLKTLYDELDYFLELNIILTPHRLSFRRSLTTSVDISNLKEYQKEAFESKGKYVGVLTYLPSAFDWVIHKIFLEKQYGVG